jgi:hypothetical protein
MIEADKVIDLTLNKRHVDKADIESYLFHPILRLNGTITSKTVSEPCQADRPGRQVYHSLVWVQSSR